MFGAFQICTVMMVALSAALSLAHALELPGKMRLDEKTYRAVQRIYYPGFTIGGFGDVLGLITTAALVLLTPTGTASFRLTVVAFAGMLGANIIYWVVVHPVNKQWMQGQSVSASAAAFFGSARGQATDSDWTALRNRWEYAHVARAVLSSAGLLALVISLNSD